MPSDIVNSSESISQKTEILEKFALKYVNELLKKNNNFIN